jgi:hypothetical protein
MDRGGSALHQHRRDDFAGAFGVAHPARGNSPLRITFLGVPGSIEGRSDRLFPNEFFGFCGEFGNEAILARALPKNRREGGVGFRFWRGAICISRRSVLLSNKKRSSSGFALRLIEG